MEPHYAVYGYIYVTDGHYNWELVGECKTLGEAFNLREESKIEDMEYLGHKIELVIDIFKDDCEDR